MADLPFTGSEVVRQAFRLGVLVNEVSGHLQPRSSTDTNKPEPWAYVLPDLAADDVQQELDAIYGKDVKPTSLDKLAFPG